MKKILFSLMALAALIMAGCEKEGDYSTDF